MSEITLKEMFEKAHSESHSRNEYWKIIEDTWAKQERDEISIDEFLQAILEFAIPMRQAISGGFQTYFASYCLATLNQCDALKIHKDFHQLLPTIYLSHHSVELFFKMVKVDIYNILGLGEKDIDIVQLLLPTNIKELHLASHKADGYFKDEDVLRWFSCVDEGEKQLTFICDLYTKLLSLVDMSNPAEEARFPLRKDSYVYVDRRNIDKEKIAECAEIIDQLIRAMSRAYVLWHTQNKAKLTDLIRSRVKERATEQEFAEENIESEN